MIVDLRIYTCLPNKMPAFVEVYERLGWQLQLKYLENCLGWYTTVEGELNTVVHLWGYADQADRERRRNALAADPGWPKYLNEVAEKGLLLKMQNRIVRPTGFFSAFQAGKKG